MSEVTDIAEGFISQHRQAASNAVATIDADPEKAARAIDLSNDTGVPAAAIHADMEGFEQRHKSALTTELLRGNPHLTEYINSHPLASSVSNDDYANLDKLSQGLGRLAWANPMTAFPKAVYESWPEILEVAKEGLHNLARFPQQAMGEEKPDTDRQEVLNKIIADQIARGLSPAQAEIQADLINKRMQRGEALQTGLFGVPTLAISPAIGMFRHYISKPIEESTGFPKEAVEGYTMLVAAAAGLKGMGHVEAATQAHEALSAADPWLRSGKEPPVGVHPLIDELKIKQSEEDLKALDESFKDAQTTATRERSPDLAAGFAKQHVGEAKIGISADALERLYGDKAPELDDGKLGWVPRIAEQYEMARATGGDIEIPLSEWLAKADPEVAKELHDDIRVRPGGVTKNEGKVIAEHAAQVKAMVEAYHGSSHEFDAFSTEKIGTEGGTSYGHGLYFAENPQVASSYRPGGGFKFIDQQGKEIPKEGAMYRVRIHANKEDFLDWDKPLSEQAPQVQALLNTLADKVDTGWGLSVHSEMQQIRQQMLRESKTVPEFYGALSHSMYKTEWGLDRDIGMKKGSERASQALRSTGIPGIKYLDQGSRLKPGSTVHQIFDGRWMVTDKEGVAQGITYATEAEAKKAIEGTHNFVLFDDSLVEITHKNDVQILRQAAKLEPMLERKLILQRSGEVVPESGSVEANVSHGFNILDQSGKPIAELYIAEEAGGKRLYIDDIHGLEGVKPGDIGLALRQLLPQLKAEFPNATELMGFRVSGARDKAGTWETHGKVSIKLDKLDDADISRFVDENGELWNYASDVQARVKPTEFFTENEQKIISAVDAEIARLTPKQAEGHVATEIKSEGKSVRGMHIQYTDRYPIILWSINAENPISTVRHEAIHHLRQQGFFTKEEWAALSFAAVDEGWIDKHKINTRYKELNNRARIEEAIAEEFGDRERKPAEGLVGKAFERLKDLLDSIKSKLKELFGKDLTVEDVFNRIERGEVGAREGNEPKVGNAFKEQRGPAQPELPGTRRVDDRKPFATPAAVGITAEKQRLYERLIAKRNAEDLEKELTRAKKEQEKRLTVEWKANEAIERQEAVRTVNSRPDVAADNFFSEGKAKFASDALTPEQKAILPKEWVAKDGASPDDLASLFSYHTGDELIDRISAYQSARKASGMKPLEYTRRLVEIETAKQMEAKYGSLEKNILAEVKDQVLSETQLDLLHEEVLREGLAHGVEYSITKEQVKSWAQENIRKVTMENLSSDKYLAEVGKAGSAIELAHLKGDTAEAFRQAQRKEFAFQLSREALKIEELKEKFDKKAKAYQRKELPNIQPEYVNYTRLMLQQLGEHFRYVNEDLVAEGKRYGYDSFANFVRAKEADFRDLHVPDFLLDPTFRKPIDQLTAGEFEQVHAALTAMDFNGRDELKLIKAGEKHDLDLVLDEMVEKLESLGPPRQYPIDRKENWAKQQGKNAWWSGITVESMLNRVDRDNPRGVFNQYLVRPFTEASNYKDRLIREFQAKVSEIGKVPNIDTKVANDLFVDPITSQPFLMRKRNVLGILQNSGNINNLTKLAKGYGLEPDQVMSWLAARTTKEDWDRAQKLGDIFNEVFEKANTMSHNVSGVGIQKLPLVPIQTPFGEYAGWYNPIKYDSLRPGKSKALLGPNVPEAEGYYRATTPQGYTEQRTGYIAPVELDLDIVPIRMKQMLHDIAMRPAVIQLSKVFYNDRFKRAMINHLGEHQAEAMIPFLRDIANAANFKSMAEYYGNQGLEFFRQNTIATLIGLNPSTVMKHGPTAAFNSLNEVGIIPFAREFATLVKSDEATNQRNWTLAMDKSEELQRRMRNYTELFAGHGSEINIRGAQTKFSSYREFMMHVGATPVSISDLLSAVPTWLAKYKEEKANNATEGDAVNLADRAVRRAHGSSVLSNKPAIARTNALGAYFSSLYGFFSHMQQKHYELGWKAKDLLKDVVGKGSGDEAGATRHVPDLLKGFMSYIIIPALIEEMVTPYTNSEKESWGMKAAKTLGLGLSSSYIGVRDFVRAIVNVRDPQAGLVGTTLKAGSDLARDLSHGPQAFTRDKAGNIIKHGFALTGILTGLTNAQEGRFAEYLWRYNHNLERPKGPWELAVGMRYGKTDKHSRSFDQWLKH